MSATAGEKQLRSLQGRERRWLLAIGDEGETAQAARNLGCSPLLARILLARGHDVSSARRFIAAPGEPSVAELDGTGAAAERIEHAIAREELVLIHGDYDVDGITSAAILSHTLRLLGARTEVFLPNRILDGYGVSKRAIERAGSAGARLFITADCGSSSAELLGQLACSGCDFIVTDHHIQEAQIDGAVAVLNPVRPGSTYPDNDLAAVGVAYKLAVHLLRRAGRDVPAMLHSIAAVGTVADVAPLRGENRDIVKRGLQAFPVCGNPGLLGLLQKASIDPRRVRAWNLAFQIGPRINAAGRMDDPSKAFAIFFETDPEKLRLLLDEIEELNQRRQRAEERITSEALLAVTPGAAAITVAGARWDRGVIGIVASRLVDRFSKPALMISLDGQVGYGSARSVPGLNLVEVLKECSRDLLTFGGHEQAAGFTLRSEEVPGFAEHVDAAVRRRGEPPPPQIRLDSVLRPEEMIFESAEELSKLEPFGQGNPEPLFLLENARLTEPARRMGSNHLLLRLDVGGRRMPAVAWRKGEWFGSLAVGRPMMCAGRLQINEYRGLKELRFQIEDYSDAV